MTRRRYPWAAIAARAQETPGAWRLHPSLVSVTDELLRHARRRVPELQPTTRGAFAFAPRHRIKNEVGQTVFDLYLRWEPAPEPGEQ